jgi:hypothetical protein
MAMSSEARERAAQTLAEAMTTGAPLSAMPEAWAPRSLVEGWRVAVRVLETLDLTPTGLRLGRHGGRPVAGPLLDARLLRSGTAIVLGGLEAAEAAPAVLAVLAEPLGRRADAPARFASLHPAIDVSGWRIRGGPGTLALAAADLAGLGFTLVGKAKRIPPAPLRIGFGPIGSRPRSAQQDLPAALESAVLAARRAGGLPAAAMLLVVLGPGIAPVAGTPLAASFGALGRVQAEFA